MSNIEAVKSVPLGMNCFSTLSDKQSGLSIELGEPQMLAHPVKNDHLTDIQRLYRGKITIMVRCDWQIIREGKLVEGWDSADLLVGLKVKKLVFVNENLDFYISFSGSTRLEVFTNQWRRSTNYSFHIDNAWWSVKAGGQATVETS